MSTVRGGQKRFHKSKKDFKAYVHSQLLSGLVNESNGRWASPRPGSRNSLLINTILAQAPEKQRKNQKNRENRKKYLEDKSWDDTISLNKRLYPKVYSQTYLP